MHQEIPGEVSGVPTLSFRMTIQISRARLPLLTGPAHFLARIPPVPGRSPGPAPVPALLVPGLP
eukprot:15647712-Heterocapsa_arctica.AAC.1